MMIARVPSMLRFIFCRCSHKCISVNFLIRSSHCLLTTSSVCRYLLVYSVILLTTHCRSVCVLHAIEILPSKSGEHMHMVHCAIDTSFL